MGIILDFNDAGPQIIERPATPKSRFDVAREFRDACVNAGLLPGDVEVSGGKLVRCPATGDKPGKKSGWFVFYADDPAAGAFGDWRTGDSGSWCAKSEVSMTPAEAAAYRYKMDKAREIREAEQAKNAAEAAKSAAEQWDKAAVAAKHPYLEKKGVSSFGLRVLGGKLLVPMRDMQGCLHSLQKIDAVGEKRFSFGGRVKGCFYLIPGDKKIAVCEGYATAASVHMATGWTTVVAFNSGNLPAVAGEWRSAHPTDDMIICGDDDVHLANNPGRTAAEAAGKACGGTVVLPDFTGVERGSGTDFNDLHAVAGLDALKRQLSKEREYRVKIKDWEVKQEYFSMEPEPRRELVERTLPMGSVVLLASLGGVGKSMKALDLALKVARKEVHRESDMDFNSDVMFFGNRVMEHGPVVIYTAEDSLQDIRHRIYGFHTDFPFHKIYCIPLIDDVGIYPFVLPGGKSGPELSSYWYETKEQLLEIQPKLIVFDPLASFALVDLNKPELANYTMSLFANLASETGACIVVMHHLAKTRDNISTPEQARTLVRGSTAIVDRTRATYVLWSVKETKSKDICAALGEQWERDKVFCGCLAKENFGGDKSIKTFIRQSNGLLVVCDDAVRSTDAGMNIILEDALEQAIAEAGERAQPFTKSGANGLMERKSELPECLRGLGRPKMNAILDKLLNSKRVVTCIALGSTTKNKLDVPGGPIAMAAQRIQPGAEDGKND